MQRSNLNFKQGFNKKPVTTYIKHAALYEPKRSMSNSRLGGTIVSIVGAVVLCYSSLFYIPALMKMSMVLGTSTPTATGNTLNTDPNAPWYTPAVNLLRLKRGYFQAGSHIKVAYNSTPGTIITLYYAQCSGFPVSEIYTCPPGPVHKYETKNHKGYIQIPVHKNGFYTFSQEVVYEDNTNPKNSFIIQWAR